MTGHSKRHLQDRVPEAENRGSLVHVPASGLRAPCALSPECPRLGSVCPLPCVPTSGLPLPSPLYVCVWAPCALFPVCPRLGSLYPLPCVPASGLRVPSPLCARVRLLVPSPLCAHVWAPGSGCPLICLLWDHTAQKPGHTSSLQKLQGESQAGLLLGHVLIPAA